MKAPKFGPILNKPFWLLTIILCIMSIALVPISLHKHRQETPLVIPNISTSVDYDSAEVLYTKIDSDCYYTTAETLANLTKDTNNVWWISPWGGHFNICYMIGGLTPDKTNLSVLVYNASNSTAQIHFGVEEDIDFIKGGGIVKFPLGFELAPNKYQLASFEIDYPLDASQAFNFRIFFTNNNDSKQISLNDNNTLVLTPIKEELPATLY